jgi:hydrogenase maturation protease
MTPTPDGLPATVVLGLGNPVRYDDAVGLHTAEAVASLLQVEPVPGVFVTTSSRAGLELVDLLTGASHAVIIDCLTLSDPVPGRVHHLTLNDVAGSARLIGAHDVSLADAFALAGAAGVPMPETIDIYAVEGADINRIEVGLSPAVAVAVPALAHEIHQRLVNDQRAPTPSSR